MGRVVGLSWIFCVKRVCVFCRRDLHHLAKATSHTTILNRFARQSALCKKSARTQTKLRLVGFSSHTQIKNAPIKGAYFYYGAGDGTELQPLLKIIAQNLEYTLLFINEFLQFCKKL